MSDELLMAIGSTGEMSISKFDEAFTELCLKDTIAENASEFRNIRRKAIRLLDALGDCEFDFTSNKVFPCPPALVILPGGGSYRAVLTGVHTPKLIEKLLSFVEQHKNSLTMLNRPQNIFTLTQDHNLLNAATLPSVIQFETLDKDLLTEMADGSSIKAYLDIPAAWALASFSIGLNEYWGRLSWDLYRSSEPNWEKRKFSPERLKFERDSAGGQPEGLVEYIDPLTYERRHWFWADDMAAVVDRDWGRYLSVAQAGRRVLVYDDRGQVLAVPASLPLPRFLARAATLCSGMVPITTTLREGAGNIPPGFPVNIYAGIPPEYMSLIALKLGQKALTSKILLNR